MSKNKEDMSINELMAYYLESSKVANGGSTSGAPGSFITVFAETVGGEGYTKEVEAQVWGELKSEPAVILKLLGNKCYAINYETYTEICLLLNSDFSNCEVTTITHNQGASPGSRIYVTPLGKPTIDAIAWYEIPPSTGSLKLFEIEGKRYAISLVASKIIYQTLHSQRKKGSVADDKREIIWHDFDLSGAGIANFPCKPKYLL
ncbi:MAG: hypothetical protein ACFKPT_07185 [Gloeotrichia echinulata GP01]